MSEVPSFERAYTIVLDYCQKLKPSGRESLPISEALGRVLAEPVIADRDFPPFPRATRDGFAVQAGDLKTVPALLNVVGQVKAGDSFRSVVQAGQAVQIMTGAAVPQGADAVVMVEYTRRNGQQVEVLRSC